MVPPQKSQVQSRAWGTRFDTLPTTPPSSPPVNDAHTVDDKLTGASEYITDSTSYKIKEEKLPHDASVFVGSLPSNIDQAELTRLLLDHMSEHTQVKNIKVVRDSKGGACAFVQCENATTASALIHTLHANPPKPFMGRTLRYEPARAFRTLLISYRTPIKTIPTGGMDAHFGSQGCNKEEEIVVLELPHTMRLSKTKNPRYYSILYNDHAVDAENHVVGDEGIAFPSEATLFFHPVLYDAETIYKVASYFGSLESFGPFQNPEKANGLQQNEECSSDDESRAFPAPHNAPRSSGMDNSCWEAKWEHRDDCVNALMTLRRVPHLTVTWAHQLHFPYPDQTTGHHSQHPHLRTSPSYSSTSRSLIAPYTPRYRHTIADDEGTTTPYPTSGETPIDHKIQKTNPNFTYKTSKHDENFDLADSDLCSKADNGVVHRAKLDWTDEENLYLTDEFKADWDSWKGKIQVEGESLDSNFPIYDRATARVDGDLGEPQEVLMPPTPSLEMSPVTPGSPGSAPTTPNNFEGGFNKIPRKGLNASDMNNHMVGNRAERVVDPTTLFVGGLEMFGPGAWDEEKLRSVFSRYEGLENVKVVRPLNSCAAFAFVKFNNVESPARAVSEQHNRMYEGRTMRVQLRDCNPTRSPWKYGKGRGRVVQHLIPQVMLGLPDQFNRSLSLSTSVREGVSTSDLNQDGFDVADSDLDGEKLHRGAKSAIVSDSKLPGSESFAQNIISGTGNTEAMMEQPSQTENYREWYDEPTPATTPVAFNSSAPTPIPFPYFGAAGGYYSPPQWISPYGQHPQYPIPYYGGYQPYPMPGQNFAAPLNSEPSGPATGVTPAGWPQMGMYGSYIPYPAPPGRTQGVDQPVLQPGSGQAPLAPSGLIQSEQGTLIAVYQPDALDQYMAGTGTAPLNQQQHVPVWTQSAQTHTYPVPLPASQSMNMPLRPFGQMPVPSLGWIPNPAHQAYTPSGHSQIPHAINGLQSTTPHRNGHYERDPSSYANYHNQRRPGTRRDQQNTFNYGRNAHGRPHGRHARSQFMNSGHHSRSEDSIGPGMRTSHSNISAGSWSTAR